VDDQTGVLQERVQVAALGGAGQQALEGVGGDQDEQQETEGDQSQRTEDTRNHGIRQLPREMRDTERPPAQHQYPQQQRAFMAAPDAGNPVFDGQQRIGVLGDIDDRKVVGDKSLRQAGEGKRHQQGQRIGARTRQRNPGQAILVGAKQRQGAEYQGDQRGKNQGKVAKFGDHLRGAFSSTGELSGGSPDNGGMQSDSRGRAETGWADQ